MNTAAKASIVAVTAFLIGISAWGIFIKGSRQDLLFDQLEIANADFKLRITAYKERFVLLPGVYYVCQSTSVRSDNWRTVLTVKTDEPHPIKRDRVRLMSNRIGYIFMGSFYMVTTDRGDTWSIWDGHKNLPDQQYREQLNISPYIEEIEMQSNGVGVMRLYKYFSERERGPDLVTSDYGLHWLVKK